MSRFGYVCPIENAVQEKTAEHYLRYLEGRRERAEEFSEEWWELESLVIEHSHDLEFYRAEIKPNLPTVALVIDNSHEKKYALPDLERPKPALTLVK